MRHVLRAVVGGAVAAAALGAVGCDRREFVPVEGRVTLDGKPLPDVEVVFMPDPTKGNVANNAAAVTDADGRYRLYAARDARKGTVTGPHRVVLIDLLAVSEAAEVPPPGEGQAARPALGPKARRFPVKYGDATDTPFKDVDVGPGRSTFDFDVKPAAVKRPG